jgi:hypothetical protein
MLDFWLAMSAPLRCSSIVMVPMAFTEALRSLEQLSVDLNFRFRNDSEEPAAKYRFLYGGKPLQLAPSASPMPTTTHLVRQRKIAPKTLPNGSSRPHAVHPKQTALTEAQTLGRPSNAGR